MTRKYFPDNTYNELPCGLVAFRLKNGIEIVYANDEYYSHFANENSEKLNIDEKDKEVILNIEEKLKTTDTAEVNYRCDMGKGNSCMVCMSVCRYGSSLYLGVLWDATEQYRIIHNLRNDKDKYAMALCSSGNMVFENDVASDTAVLYIPSADTNEIRTVNMSDYKTRALKQIVHPNDIRFFDDHVYNDKEKILSARMKLPGDSNWKWYRVHRRFEYDGSGNISRIFGIITNIEAEKRHEKELKKKMEIDPVLKIYNRNAAVDKINEYLK
ncbi:MAG: hypothetical protein ACI4A5_03985, partial [Hominilimicola sp.]